MIKKMFLSAVILLSACGSAQNRVDFTDKIRFSHNGECIHFKYPISERAFNVALTLDGTYPTELQGYPWKFKTYDDFLGIGQMETKNGNWNGLTIVRAFTTGWLSSEKAADGILIKENIDEVNKVLEERGIILSDIARVEPIRGPEPFINTAGAQTMIFCDYDSAYPKD